MRCPLLEIWPCRKNTRLSEPGATTHFAVLFFTAFWTIEREFSTLRWVRAIRPTWQYEAATPRVG